MISENKFCFSQKSFYGLGSKILHPTAWQKHAQTPIVIFQVVDNHELRGGL